MAKHKHCELIKAWADGAEIQRRKYASNEWVDTDPDWRVGTEYRIKPRTVTKVGWVNIHKTPDYLVQMNIWESESEAQANRYVDCVATVKVEWEEEE